MSWILAAKHGYELDPNKTYNCRFKNGKIEIQECGCMCHKLTEVVRHYVACCSKPTPDGRIYLERDPIVLRFQWEECTEVTYKGYGPT
jgi:hypothetical protein